MDWTIGVIERERMQAGAPLPTVAEAGRFASSLLSRYEARRFVASGADLALAWETARVLNENHFSTRVEVSPRITVDQSYTFPGFRPEKRALTPAAAFDEQRAAALFERLFTRSARFAAIDSPREAIPPSTTAAKQALIFAEQRASAVERALPVRPAIEKTPPAAELAHAPAGHKLDDGWGTPLAKRETPAPVTLAAPEIRRVTDQVMREIDHRTRAVRERTGRQAR